MTQNEGSDIQSDTLCILWTSGDPEVAIKMVFMYANAAKQYKWFDEVELIIWGPSSKLTSKNKDIQDYIGKMLKNGIKIEACKACADSYGVSDKLKSLGIDVKYMGQPLTGILRSNKKLMTF
ncbi:MAG: DsrE family protein [FCB group bacterium]|nr:DsrE family protein [FCB group bacterium]